MASDPTHTKEHQSYTAYRTPTHAEIEKRARELWLEAGQPEGRDLEHWLAAEKSLQFPNNVNEEVNPAVPPRTPSPRQEDATPKPSVPGGTSSTTSRPRSTAKRRTSSS